MRVLVCGGREFDDIGMLFKTLNKALTEFPNHVEPFVVIHGDAKGADFLARCWAKYVGVEQIPFPAKWKEFGKAAGGIRNQQMIDEGKPDIVISFPGGTGTADMVRRARNNDIKVI